MVFVCVVLTGVGTEAVGSHAIHDFHVVIVIMSTVAESVKGDVAARLEVTACAETDVESHESASRVDGAGGKLGDH